MNFLGWILGIFKVAFGFALGWIKGGRIWILTAISLYIGFVLWAFSQVGDSFVFVIDCLDSFKSFLEQAMQYLKSLEWFSLLYYTFALDVLASNLFSQLSLLFAFILFSVVSSAITAFAVFVPILIWRTMSRMLTSTTGGLVKT